MNKGKTRTEKDKQLPGNLVLIGFMGTGKSSVARLAAASLGFEFVDTDELIVRKAGKPITRLFAEAGESAFRDLETEVLRGLAGRENLVVSTGGGIVLRPENRELLRQIGFTVWLTARPETVYHRVAGNRDRPLLQTDDPQGTIARMMAERDPLYRAASDLTVETDDLSLDEAAYGIVESARIRRK